MITFKNFLSLFRISTQLSLPTLNFLFIPYNFYSHSTNVIWSLEFPLGISFTTCYAKKHDKIGHLLGFVPQTYFCRFGLFINICSIRLEVPFFMNDYFLVCLFKQRTSTPTFSLKILGVRYLVVIYPFIIIGHSTQSTKTITPATTTADDRWRSIPWLRIYYGNFYRSYVPLMLC